MAEDRSRRSSYKSPLTPLKTLMRPLQMTDLRKAVDPVMVEPGKDASVLVIAFTSTGENFAIPVWEFMETTQILGYSRILLRDRHGDSYHSGIDDQRPDFASVIAYLKEEIARLNPATIVTVGSSSGGYAALRCGFELAVDYVHAFSPQTCDQPEEFTKAAQTERHSREDLAGLLAESNGKTVYYVHYGCGHRKDTFYASRLDSTPGVVTLGYPYDYHKITLFLAKKKLLTELLLKENQPNIVALARRYFPDLKLAGFVPCNDANQATIGE